MGSDESDQAISRLFKAHRDELTYKMPESLRNQIQREPATPAYERMTLLSWMSFGGGALAAGVALVLAFQLGRLSTSGQGHPLVTEEIVSAHVRSLMAGHLSDVVSTDQHTVKPWFEGKIDFGPTVKDFAAQGFPLLGGRLDYIDGRPAAALVYRSNQHMINVLQYPAPGLGSSSPQLQTLRGYQVFAWTKDGMRFWAVSDVNAADLQRFVDLWF